MLLYSAYVGIYKALWFGLPSIVIANVNQVLELIQTRVKPKDDLAGYVNGIKTAVLNAKTK